MYKPFFPSVDIAWVYVGFLACILGIAAYQDLRTARIPKWLTLPLLGLGILANLIRGAWLGYNETDLWLFETGSPVIGALDGLLFSLFGVVVGFALLFLLWIMGTCGGGDVKLFAGLGAWTGPIHIIFVLTASTFVATILVIGKMLTGQSSPSQMRKNIEKAKRHQAGMAVKIPRNRLTYSLPVALATLVVMLWVYRYELSIAPSASPGIPAAKVMNLRDRA